MNALALFILIVGIVRIVQTLPYMKRDIISMCMKMKKEMEMEIEIEIEGEKKEKKEKKRNYFNYFK